MEILATMNPFARRSFWASLALSVVVVGALVACDGERDDQSPPKVEEAPLIEHPLESVFAVEATDLREIIPGTLRRLQAFEARLYESCREFFEEDGRFLDWPFSEQETPRALFGCDPESYVDLNDGGRVIAYATSMPGHERATDLQVLAYDADGSLRWDYRLDRSEEAANFVANFRGSYLTEVGQYLICVGTLWQGATQLSCLRRESGEAVFEGSLGFWAGLEPFGYDGSLFSTDIKGITRRYPFQGTEMRHRDLEGRGGRAAFYASDKERIFFVPAEDTPWLSAWDLKDMRRIWRTELPGRPRITLAEASAEHELLLLKVEDRLYGFDTIDGTLRMAFDVGSAHPPVAFSEDSLYLLLRREEDPPLLYAIDPRDGSIHWSAMAPSGTLDIAYDDGLLVRSVRAVRSVRPLDDEGDADD